MSIQITSDSTCDLGHFVKSRKIGIMPLGVILGDKSFHDGVDVTPKDIFDFYENEKQLPKTSAPSVGEYEDFFQSYIDRGDEVVHVNISSKASSSHEHAKAAAEKFGGRVRVVDSRALSSGQGLVVMKALDLLEEGKDADEIVETITALLPKVNTSFVPDRLDYLYKGGRCSRMQMYGANLLKIHPLIEMEDGQLVAQRRYRGSMEKCISNYIEDLSEQYPEVDETRCFITHSSADESLVKFAVKKTSETFSFREINETVAGSVITGHCGRNTLGLLFISK